MTKADTVKRRRSKIRESETIAKEAESSLGTHVIVSRGKIIKEAYRTSVDIRAARSKLGARRRG